MDINPRRTEKTSNVGIIASQIAQNNPSIENIFSVYADPFKSEPTHIHPQVTPDYTPVNISDNLPLSSTAFKQLLILREDRDLSGCTISERPIENYMLRLGKGDRIIRMGFKELEERGFAGSSKGTGRGHITQRWITEEGYLWLVNQTAGVTADVIISTPYRSLIQRKEERKEILECGYVDKSQESQLSHPCLENLESDQDLDEAKLLEHRLTLINLSDNDKRIILNKSKRLGLHYGQLLEVAGRVYKATRKTAIEFKMGYFLKAVQSEYDHFMHDIDPFEKRTH